MRYGPFTAQVHNVLQGCVPSRDASASVIGQSLNVCLQYKEKLLEQLLILRIYIYKNIYINIHIM